LLSDRHRLAQCEAAVLEAQRDSCIAKDVPALEVGYGQLQSRWIDANGNRTGPKSISNWLDCNAPGSNVGRDGPACIFLKIATARDTDAEGGVR
jgi:hypothetical protein